MKYWLPFGEILTNMERKGILVNKEILEQIKTQAEKLQEIHYNKFLSWVFKIRPECKHFNPGSTVQMQQLLFAPYKKGKENDFAMEDDIDDDFYTEEEVTYSESSFAQHYKPQFYNKKKSKTKKDEIEEKDEKGEKEEKQSKQEDDIIPEVKEFEIMNPNWPQSKPRMLKMTIKGLGLNPISFTEKGMAQANAFTLKRLSGKNPAENQFGAAFKEFEQKGYSKEESKEICLALDSFLQYKQIGTLLNTFIIPLLKLPDQNNRIHCSLNLNTETGRLSSRKPNLQNQPALDKVICHAGYFQAKKSFLSCKRMQICSCRLWIARVENISSYDQMQKYDRCFQIRWRFSFQNCYGKHQFRVFFLKLLKQLRINKYFWNGIIHKEVLLCLSQKKNTLLKEKKLKL